MPNDAEAIRGFLVERVRQAATTKGQPLDNVGDDYSLMESALFDSLGFIQLLSDLEATFHVEVDFSDADPDTFTTVGGLVRLVNEASRPTPDQRRIPE